MKFKIITSLLLLTVAILFAGTLPRDYLFSGANTTLRSFTSARTNPAFLHYQDFIVLKRALNSITISNWREKHHLLSVSISFTEMTILGEHWEEISPTTKQGTFSVLPINIRVFMKTMRLPTSTKYHYLESLVLQEKENRHFREEHL